MIHSLKRTFSFARRASRNLTAFYTHSQLSGYSFLKSDPKDWKNLRDWRFYFGRKPFLHKCVVRGLTIYLLIESKIELYRALTYTSKEPETLDWIDQYFRPHDVFYDIGANIGLYSLYVARRLKEKCSVYAFEPESFNCAKLNMNIRANGLQGIVIPLGLAIAETTEVGILYSRDVLYGTAMHEFRRPVDHRGKSFIPAHQQLVASCSLDELQKYDCIQFPNHIKIDVDGIESLIIEGATQTLRDDRLQTMQIEIADCDNYRAHIIDRLTSYGFYLANQECIKENLDTQNYIFVRHGNLAS